MKGKIALILSIVLLITGVGFWFNFSYLKILPAAAGFKKPMTYLILMQNNYEIRATGGYIGSFGIATIEKAKIKELKLFNTNEFDAKSKAKVKPPQPLNEFLHIENWQLRDSNWSPDFPTSAVMAEKFYNLQSGENINFDGVIAVNANILPAILEVVGTIKIDGSEFNKDNAALALEYEVEQGFYKKGAPKEERKEILFRFIKEVIKKVDNLSPRDKVRLAKSFRSHTDSKDILIYFNNEKLEKIVKKQSWGGNVIKPNNDYLMLVDSNLGAFKSDLFVRRSLEYTVDFSDTKKPRAKLVINYEHNAKEENWLVKDYRNWLRVYAPKGSSLVKTAELKSKPSLEIGKNHNIFGGFIEVALAEKKSIGYEYDLPSDIVKNGSYKLLIQKQSGIEKIPVTVTIVNSSKLGSVKRIYPNEFSYFVSSKNQIIFKKDILTDEVFEVKFDIKE